MVFDKYFSVPAALARHRSAPLARERELFLTHLEAGGTGRQTIRTAACYLIQVVRILGLRRLRDVTLEEVEQAANRWNELRNEDGQYTAGKLGVQCFAGLARRFLRFPHSQMFSSPLKRPFGPSCRTRSQRSSAAGCENWRFLPSTLGRNACAIRARLAFCTRAYPLSILQTFSDTVTHRASTCTPD